MLRGVRRMLVALGAAAGGVLLVGAFGESAAACGGVGVACEPEVDGRTVTVTVTGSLVRSGTPGSPGGSTTVVVQVPCYLTAAWTGKEYFDGIQDGTITSAGWDEWGGDPDMWPYPGYQQHKDDTEGHWYTPTCRMTDVFDDFEDFDQFAVDYSLSYPTTFVEPGETPPVPPVPPEVLLQAAQDAMEVPEPAFEFNPDVVGDLDTLVNLDTWFWLSDPTQDGSATATAGANTVTVDATLASVVFSAPTAGAVPCEGTGVSWSPGAASDCTMTFERAGPTEVTADTQWTLEWSFNGTPQGDVDPPLTAGFTQTVGVAESQALVTRVD